MRSRVLVVGRRKGRRRRRKKEEEGQNLEIAFGARVILGCVKGGTRVVLG